MTPPAGTQRIPAWLRRPVRDRVSRGEARRAVVTAGVRTVCEAARCPNRGVCWGDDRTATFLLLGPGCSRRCRFCAVAAGPAPVEADEPERVAAAARVMALDYVVLTSTTRDDLPDGGASHYVATTAAVKQALPAARVEVLIPDFKGQAAAVDRLLAAPVDVIAHNVETVPRLYPAVRPGATYRRSLDVLRRARDGGKVTKSSLLVGLGETAAEVNAALRDLRNAGVAVVTVGQYLRPGPAQLAVARYWEPAAFERWETAARALGFAGVASGPFVRSSYRAAELYLAAARRLNGAAS